MYKFDVKYTLDNYYEYYKYVLVKQKIVRDLLFCFLFIAFALYLWIDTTEETAGNTLPIFSVVMAIMFPLMNVLTLPVLKRQLKAKNEDVKNTHLIVTFGEKEVIYENHSTRDEAVAKPVPVDEQEAKVVDEDSVEEKQELGNDKIFALQYDNFMSVKETANLFMFYLDKRTVIILPKETYVGEESLEEFKKFILSKINIKRVRFLKSK